MADVDIYDYSVQIINRILIKLFQLVLVIVLVKQNIM